MERQTDRWKERQTDGKTGRTRQKKKINNQTKIHVLQKVKQTYRLYTFLKDVIHKSQSVEQTNKHTIWQANKQIPNKQTNKIQQINKQTTKNQTNEYRKQTKPVT